MNNENDGVTSNHIININERKTIFMTGIKKLNSFDENEFFVDTIMGQIVIKGESLELIKLDTFQGNISIKGTIGSAIYLDSEKKE